MEEITRKELEKLIGSSKLQAFDTICSPISMIIMKWIVLGIMVAKSGIMNINLGKAKRDKFEQNKEQYSTKLYLIF